MTIQNKAVVQVGPIKWGKGFSGSLEYPTNERLEAFLRTNPDDENDVADYCSKYKHLPNISSGKSITQAFSEEQEKLKDIAKRAVDNSLTLDDIDTINKNLPTKQLRVTLTNNTSIHQVTTSPELEPLPNQRDTTKYLLDEYSLSGTLSTLWEDMVRLALQQQRLRSCLNCGKFFVKKSNRKQINCSSECQEARKKRNQYVKK